MKHWLRIIRGYSLIALGPPAFIGGIFLLMLGPQIALAFVLRSGGGPLLCSMVALFLCGRIWRRCADMRISVALIALILALITLTRACWHPFEIRAGLFPALSCNRISAAALLALSFFGYFALKWIRSQPDKS